MRVCAHRESEKEGGREGGRERERERERESKKGKNTTEKQNLSILDVKSRRLHEAVSIFPWTERCFCFRRVLTSDSCELAQL